MNVKLLFFIESSHRKFHFKNLRGYLDIFVQKIKVEKSPINFSKSKSEYDKLYMKLWGKI